MRTPPPFHTRNSRNKTGCHGVSLTTRRIKKPSGRVVTRRYFNAYAGGTNQTFRIFGDERAAFRRAVAYRAAFEQRVTGKEIR